MNRYIDKSEYLMLIKTLMFVREIGGDGGYLAKEKTLFFQD